jgi:uncharacterized membrane protein YdjX (TVP38/TMEM64 family)
MSEAEPPKEAEAKPRRGRALGLVALVLLFAGGILAFRFTPLEQYAKIERVRPLLDGVRGHWWAGPTYAAAYGALCVLGVPGTLLTVAGALAFGPWWGVVWVMAGSNLGVNAAFWVARLLGKGWLDEKLKGSRLDALNERLASRGLLRVIQLRLIPAVPFNFLNFACGLSKVRWVHYALGSLIGMFPATVAFVYFTGALGEAILAKDPSPEARRALWISAGAGLAILGVVSLIPAIARRLNRRRSEDSPDSGAGGS